MNEEESVNNLIRKIMELKVQGKTDSEIRKTLESDGISTEIINTALREINSHIATMRASAQRRGTLETVGLQALCIVVCGASIWAFISFMQRSGNLAPINILGINIIDTIVATGLASLALSAFGTFIALFGRYSD